MSRRPLSTSKGKVLMSTEIENINRDESRAAYFRHGKESFFAGDISKDLITDEPTWIIAAPVNDPVTQRALGVIAFRINPGKLSLLTSGRRALSKGADTQSFVSVTLGKPTS